MPTVLVIDDSMFQRTVLCNIIQKMGYQHLQAATGQEGLELAKKHTPDTILLDLLMPDMNGMEVLEKLRKSSPSLSVVVCSADIQQNVRDKCMDLGAKAFLNKPILETKLIETLQSIINT